MNIFGIKARRGAAGPVSARPALARSNGWLSDRWSRAPQIPHSYAEQVRAAYGANPVAQRCCRLIAEAVGSAPLLADDPAVLALLSARGAGQVLMETVATHLLLHGNAYVQILPGAGDAPGELYALRPDRIAVELDAQGWPNAFSYRIGGQGQRLPAVDPLGRAAIIHIRNVNPLDDHYGLGSLSAAAQAVAIHNAAGQWNHALLDNAARPSGALVYDPGEPGATLSSAQFERLRQEMAEQFQGGANAGRPMLLEGGLKWQTISLTPAEMDFQALKDSAARDIAMAFGVPPMLIGIPGDATYANYREASKALWRQTVLPLVNAILVSISQGLGSWAVNGRLVVALDRVPALSEDRERLWAQVTAADFLSPQEKRAMLDIEDSSLAFPARKRAQPSLPGASDGSPA